MCESARPHRAAASGQAAERQAGNLEKITDNRDDRAKRRRGKNEREREREREEVRCAIVRKSKPEAPVQALAGR